MSTFNTTRFGQALKCQFLVLRKTWIRLFGIFTLVMFMANLFFTRVQSMEYDDMVSQWPMEDVIIHYGNYVGSTTGFGVIFFCFSMLFGASFLFAGMKLPVRRHEGHAQALGLPALACFQPGEIHHQPAALHSVAGSHHHWRLSVG